MLLYVTSCPFLTPLLLSSQELLRLLMRLVSHATENYARLRLSLSKDSPTFVSSGILSYYAEVLNDPAHKRFHQRSLLCVQTLAVLTFKNKAVRGPVAEAHESFLETLLQAENALANKPELFAALVKLHMNIEGGHGPKWQDYNVRVFGIFRDFATVFERGGAKAVVFARCLEHNVDGVPMNRASRANGAPFKALRRMAVGIIGQQEVEVEGFDENVNIKTTKNKKKKRKEKNKQEGVGGGEIVAESKVEEEVGDREEEEEGLGLGGVEEEKEEEERKEETKEVVVREEVKKEEVKGSDEAPMTFAQQWEDRVKKDEQRERHKTRQELHRQRLRGTRGIDRQAAPLTKSAQVV